ncbi:MAG: RNA 2'-phosphotransferase [Sphingobacteriales bacterium JAD_PAG50586_3]|nr:MAG: RNA 2'-phosphotransferase [Sphingobacteriales bacterium JAD_PAG50586_3]
MSNHTHLSKFISLVLRHKPETIGVTLDENGWADVADLLQKFNAHGTAITFDELKAIVDENTKKRFAFNDDFTKIRANQGHSVEVDLKLQPQTPPAILYHGTALKNLDSIKEKGLLKGERQHVHLSDNIATATQVGSRHGKPIVLHIDTVTMLADGHIFYLSDNNVWLTDFVPAEYIVI